MEEIIEERSTIDPITLEVIRNGLASVADEMIAALVRTGYSTNIKDRRDASCALYSIEGDLIAQSEIGTPLHLGTMYSAIPWLLRVYPVDDLEPGDSVAFNIPYPSGPGHLNDLTLVSPVHESDRIIGFVANQAHHVDMGGFAPGSMPFGVSEIYQEGIQIPPVSLFRGTKLDEQIWGIIKQNLRTPTETRGDLMAQYAANVVGGRRYRELTCRYGVEELQLYIDELQDYSERRMRSAIRKIRPGKYEFEDVVEGDGIEDRDFNIRVMLEAKGDSLVVDFGATDDSARGPINCRWPSVAASVFYVLKAVLDPDIPPSAGAYRPIELQLRPGSLLSAEYPSAVCNSNIITTQRIVDVLLGALADVIPDRISAACAGTMNIINIGGVDPESGEYFNFVETYGGGQGASQDADGMSGIQHHMTNTRNAPIESIELAYPVRVQKYALESNSEGAGTYRGGFGIRREIRVLAPEVRVTFGCDRRRNGPWGLNGGLSGARSICTLGQLAGDEILLPPKTTRTVYEGQVLTSVTPGGGGWGDPCKRDADLVAWDVREGLISLERARNTYRVVIDPISFCVDEKATRALREARGTSGQGWIPSISMFPD